MKRFLGHLLTCAALCCLSAHALQLPGPQGAPPPDASTLTGTTLAASIVNSSLTAFGSSPTLVTPIFTGLPTGTGVSSAATASTLASRDASGNLFANNLVDGYATTATAAGTTTLGVTDKYQQYFTGGTTQTVKLPDTSTLSVGVQYLIVNNSTGAVTVQTSTAAALTTMVGLSSSTYTCISTAGNTAAAWSAAYVPAITNANTASTVVSRDGAGNFSAGTITAALTGTASNVTTNANLTGAVTSVGNATSSTITSPIITTGLTASGSAANTFAASSGTFITSTGANTLSGATTINDATTPSLTTASGKTNTGFVLINGKTSGSFKILPADATAQAVTEFIAAQTTGATTLTIPDQGGTSRNYVFDTLTQGLTNKTINGNTFTAGTYTLTGSAAKTLNFTNTLTLSGTDSTTMTFPTTTATIARTDAANTFTGIQTFSTAIAIGSGGTNSAAALGGGRSIISNATGIVESNGYSKKTAVGPYVIVVADNQSVIDADATSNAVGFTLPACATTNVGFRVTIRRIDFNHVANAVTITPNGADGIDGRAVGQADNLNSNATNAQYAQCTYVSTGAAGAGAGQGWIVEHAVDKIQSILASGSAITPANATTANVTSIALTAGEWDVSAMAAYAANGGTTSAARMSISTTSITEGTEGDNMIHVVPPTVNYDGGGTIPVVRISVGTSATAYLVTINSWTGTATKTWGRITALRIR